MHQDYKILEFVYDVDNLDTPMVNTQNIGDDQCLFWYKYI